MEKSQVAEIVNRDTIRKSNYFRVPFTRSNRISSHVSQKRFCYFIFMSVYSLYRIFSQYRAYFVVVTRLDICVIVAPDQVLPLSAGHKGLMRFVYQRAGVCQRLHDTCFLCAHARAALCSVKHLASRLSLVTIDVASARVVFALPVPPRVLPRATSAAGSFSRHVIALHPSPAALVRLSRH